ncbi:COP9 signalosome complex subunit 6, partial [Trypanosoma rangeli]
MSSKTTDGEISPLLLHMGQEEPSRPVRLSPIVILSITHHATKMQEPTSTNTATSIFGILLGRTTDDGETEVVLSFQAVGHGAATTAAWGVDWQAVRQRRERLAEVFAELAVVGCYGAGRTEEDVGRCCGVMCGAPCEVFQDTPNGVVLALLVDCAPAAALAGLPVHLFEAVILRDDGPRAAETEDDQRERAAVPRPRGFNSGVKVSLRATGHSGLIVCSVTSGPRLMVCSRRIPFSLGSGVVAQIGVGAAISATGRSSQSGAQGTTGAVPSRLRCIERSLRRLRRCVVLAVEYLSAVESGRVLRPAPDVLRAAARVCWMLSGHTPGASRCAAAV